MAPVSATSIRFEPSLKLSHRTCQVHWPQFLFSCSPVFVQDSTRTRDTGHMAKCARDNHGIMVIQRSPGLLQISQVLGAVSVGWTRRSFPSLRSSRFRIYAVEIVMSLEEEFGIGVEEESSDNITTVQEAADLIEKLVQKKGGAS